MALSDSDLESLKRTYRDHLASPTTASCPPEEQLAALVVGELEGEPRREIADHVVSCRGCAEAYKTLLSLDEQARPRRAWNRLAPRWPHALAAALLISVGAGVYFGWRAPAPASSGTDAVRGAAPSSVRPVDGAPLTEHPEQFSWPAQLGATGYRVRLFQADGSLIWESETVAVSGVRPSAELPLQPGASYFWTVDVEGSVQRSQLGPFRFRLQR